MNRSGMRDRLPPHGCIAPKTRIALPLHAGYLDIQCLDHAAPTGLFFDQQTLSSVVAAVQQFEAEQHRITACRDNALRFAPNRFRAEFTAFVEGHWQAFQIQIYTPPHLRFFDPVGKSIGTLAGCIDPVVAEPSRLCSKSKRRDAGSTSAMPDSNNSASCLVRIRKSEP